MNTRIILSIVALITGISLNAQKLLWEERFVDNSHLWEIHKEELRKSEITDNMLTDWNGERDKTVVNVTEISSDGMEFYTISAKLSNLHSTEGEKYPQYSYTENGDIKKHLSNMPHTEWGFTWDYENENNYHGILFKYSTKLKNNFENKRFVFCKIFSVISGKTIIHTDWNCNNRYSYDYKQNDNILNIVKEDGSYKVYVGSNGQSLAGTFTSLDTGGKKAGIILGTGAKVALKHMAVKQTVRQRIKKSGWDEEKIKEKIKKRLESSIEGVWQVLSFHGDTAKLIPGGIYTIGIVKDNQTYKIIYLSGLSLQSPISWKTGMIKGVCKQSDSNPNLFSGEWIGAEIDVFGPIYMGINNQNDELIIAFDKNIYLKLKRITELPNNHI